MAQSILHPGAKWIFRLQGYFSFVFLFLFLFILLLIPLRFNLALGSIVFIILLILGIFVGEIYARFAYHNWMYEFTATNLKIERGIITKRYTNVPYERVQNVDIVRGIMARIFGYSTVIIQTAGYSAYRANPTALWGEGYIPAVTPEEAEKIREFLMHKISGKSSKDGL